MIHAYIYGRLGKDPKVGTTKKGQPYTQVSLAVNSGREGTEETTWITVFAFGSQGEALGATKKGECMGAVGRLFKRSYTGTDGVEKLAWSLSADTLIGCQSERSPRKQQARPNENDASFGGDMDWYSKMA